jgi:protein-S-isoprenylcysteine O-methyltransferase Ste14
MRFGTILVGTSVVWVSFELFLALFKRARITDSRQDKSTMRILWIVIALSVNTGVFFGLQRFGHLGSGSFPFQVGGVALIVCGIAVRWVAILTLKKQFTVDVAITEDHRLVTHGIYHYVRHPSYSGSLLSFLGLGLALANYVSLIIVFVPVCGVFLYRIRTEERVLVHAFGKEYLDYCSKTKRLFPLVY